MLTRNTRPPAHRILVIDDELAVHEQFRRIFASDWGRSPPPRAAAPSLSEETAPAAPQIQVDTALQGKEGLARVQRAMAQSAPYALVFVDLHMPPGRKRTETISKLWRRDPELHVAILAEHNDGSLDDAVAELGSSDRLLILRKPLASADVLQVTRVVIEMRRLAQQARSMPAALPRSVEERTAAPAGAGDRLQASEAQYRLLFDSNPNPMWVYDLGTLNFLTVNDAAIRHYGYSERQFLDMTIRDIRPADDIASLEMDVALQRPGKHFGTWRHRRQDGSLITVEISSDTIIYDGRPARLVLAHDVTERVQAESRVKHLNRVYATLSQINTLIVRAQGREELFRGACRIAVEMGAYKMAWIGVIDPRSLQGETVAWHGAEEGLDGKVRFTAREGTPDSERPASRAVRQSQAVICNDIAADPAVAEYRDELTSGGQKALACLPLAMGERPEAVLGLFSGEPGTFDDEEMRLLRELADDISFALDHLKAQERLIYLAYYDKLTGLANRSLFLERMSQLLHGARSGGHRLALGLIDLERFKNINHALGRAAGDALLRQVADWLTHNLGDAALLGRVDADRFAVALARDANEDDVRRLFEETLAALLRHSFPVNETVVRIGAKAGVALSPDDAQDADTLFKNADAALEKAKAGGDRCLFYALRMTDTVTGRFSLENQLRHAIDRGEFVLHYQPKLSVDAGRITGAEALIRWNDPRAGLVPPGRFIPTLEETGLIREVGRWVLQKAIDDYLRRRAAGLPAVRIAVNVSPLQLRNRDFIAEVRRAIDVDAHAAGGLELEITESLVMEDVAHSAACLEAIRAMGVTIAIDDFGTGFSSLSYLSKLPVDLLKIDRSFVNAVTAGPDGLTLVSTIVNLAHSLKLKVVAEGVETDEQLRLLKLLHCDEMQGYLISEPVASEVFEARFLAPPKSSSG